MRIIIQPAMREGEIALVESRSVSSYEEASANAHLIAAAPDLYERLAEAESLFSSRGLLANDPACGAWIKATREALSRATQEEET
jgi:hypothetical protein